MSAVTCTDSNILREGLTPVSSLTNYVGGEVLNIDLPAHTETTWGHEDGTEILRDVLDADGCRHYDLRECCAHPKCPGGSLCCCEGGR